jgi:hypothetical protein
MEGLQRKDWRTSPIPLTQVSPTLSQSHQTSSQKVQSSLHTMKLWMRSTMAFFPSSLGQSTPLPVMIKLSMRPHKGKEPILRMSMQIILLNTCTLAMNIAYFQALPNPSNASWPAPTPPTSPPHSCSNKHLVHANRKPHQCTHCVPKLLTALQGHSQSPRPPTTSEPPAFHLAPLRSTPDLH